MARRRPRDWKWRRGIARPTWLVFLLAAALAAVPSLLTARADAPQVISGPSAYASCSTSGSDTVYPNAETSPSIAVNPTTVGTNSVNLVAVWEQDHWRALDARGLEAAYSLDGGKTWARSTIPMGQCADGASAYDRVEQPWISIGPDGTAYVAGAANKADGNAIVVSTSPDRGKTWSAAVTITENAASTNLFADEPKVTADPTKAGTAYLTWNRNLLTDNGPITTWFSKTTDGGKSWSTPIVLVNEKNWYAAIGTPLLVDSRSGILYQAFLQITPHKVVKKTCKVVTKKGQKKKVCTSKRVIPQSPTFSDSLGLEKSTDGGQSWSSSATIRKLVPVIGSFPRIAGALTWASAIDPASGKLYVAFGDGSLSGGKNFDLSLVSSSNGGATWSNPTRLSSAPTASASEPALAVSSSGVVGALYYDFRSSTSSTQMEVDAWFTSSGDGGAHFGNEQHLGGSYDLSAAPNVSSFGSSSPYIGSYQGLTAAGPRFQAAFVAVNPYGSSNPTDILTASIDP